MKEKYDNVVDVVNALYDEYQSCFAQQYAEMHGIDDTDKITDADIYSMIESDLDDKGFNEKEIQEIVNRKMCNDTFYKLGAYMIALYGAEDYDELVEIIKDDVGANLPKTELKKLWEAYSEIDY